MGKGSQTTMHTLEQTHELLLRTRLTVAVAESCTGGLLGAALTEMSGSSAYFLGGVLAYHDSVKVGLLGVQRLTIAEHGAVSGPVAREMAEGVRQAVGADLGISITGVAGPTGGTEAKPAGTTFICVTGLGMTRTERFTWAGDRRGNREHSVRAALGMLAELIERKFAAVSRAPLSRQQPE